MSDEKIIQWMIFEEFRRQRLVLLQLQVKRNSPRVLRHFGDPKWRNIWFFGKEKDSCSTELTGLIIPGMIVVAYRCFFLKCLHFFEAQDKRNGLADARQRP